MQEMSKEEVEAVSGADLNAAGGPIAMIVAGAWAGAVFGAAVGSIVPGIGTIGGAGAGFAFSVGVGVAGYFAMT